MSNICEYCNKGIANHNLTVNWGCGKRMCDNCNEESPRNKCPLCKKWHRDTHLFCTPCLRFKVKLFPSIEEQNNESFMYTHNMFANIRCIGTCNTLLHRGGKMPEHMCYCLYNRDLSKHIKDT